MKPVFWGSGAEPQRGAGQSPAKKIWTFWGVFRTKTTQFMRVSSMPMGPSHTDCLRAAPAFPRASSTRSKTQHTRLNRQLNRSFSLGFNVFHAISVRLHDLLCFESYLRRVGVGRGAFDGPTLFCSHLWELDILRAQDFDT